MAARTFAIGANRFGWSTPKNAWFAAARAGGAALLPMQPVMQPTYSTTTPAHDAQHRKQPFRTHDVAARCGTRLDHLHDSRAAAHMLLAQATFTTDACSGELGVDGEATSAVKPTTTGSDGAAAVLTVEQLMARDDYSFTLPPDCMPFVNRAGADKMLAGTWCRNSLLLMQYSEAADGDIMDARNLLLPFSTQAYGSGKTTMAKTFPQRLKQRIQPEGEMHEWSTKLAAREQAELALLANATTCHVKLAGEPDMMELVATKLAGELGMPYRDGTSWSKVVRTAWEGSHADKPLYIHFDEVGVCSQQELQQLRGAMVSLLEIWAKYYYENRTTKRRIYFYLTGKVAGEDAALAEIGKSSAGSPCGVAWILLEQLQDEHVLQVVEHLEQLEEHPLKLHGLTQASRPAFARQLQVYAGGVPRMTLYTLRALHHLGDRISLDTDANIEAAFEAAWVELKQVDEITSEITFNNKTGLRVPWLWLLLVANMGLPVTLKSTVPLAKGGVITVEECMRQLCVYVASADAPSHRPGQQFRLAALGFALKHAHEEIAAKGFVTMLRLSDSTPQVPDEGWKGFEDAVQSWLRVVAGFGSGLGCSWAVVMPWLNHPDVPAVVKKALVPATVNSDSGVHDALASVHNLPKVGGKGGMKPADVSGHLQANAKAGQVVSMADRSMGPDTGIYGGPGGVNIWFQCKFTEPDSSSPSELDGPMLKKEIQKSECFASDAAHNVLVVCASTLRATVKKAFFDNNNDVEAISDCWVLKPDKEGIVKVARTRVAIPQNWTVVVLTGDLLEKLRAEGIQGRRLGIYTVVK